MSIEVGNILPGKVTGITNFGAFIDLGDRKTGLVHISEVSDSYIKDIKDVLTVGDEVQVRVMTVAADGKISLSIRRAVDKPAEDTKSQRTYNKPAPTRSSESQGQRKPSFSSNHSKPNFSGSKSSPALAKSDDFDSLMSAFLKDSDDRLTSLKRSTEGKRGGRGGRCS